MGQTNITELAFVRLYRLTYPCDKYFFIDKLSSKYQLIQVWNPSLILICEDMRCPRKRATVGNVVEREKSTKNWHIPNYALSSSYSRLKQIWFPHTHTHRERIFIDCSKNFLFIEFFSLSCNDIFFTLENNFPPRFSQTFPQYYALRPTFSFFGFSDFFLVNPWIQVSDLLICVANTFISSLSH